MEAEHGHALDMAIVVDAFNLAAAGCGLLGANVPIGGNSCLGATMLTTGQVQAID